MDGEEKDGSPFDQKLADEINRVFSSLLNDQIELDDEARRCLYENMWDLYD